MATRLKLKPDTLQNKIKGTIILPDHSAYDDARRIWNAMINRRPALMVRCAEDTDVTPAIALHGSTISRFRFVGEGTILVDILFAMVGSLLISLG